MCFLTNILDVKAYLSVKLSWFWSSMSLMLVCKSITWRAKHMIYCSTIIIICLSCYTIFLILHMPLSRLLWRSYASGKFPSQSVATSLMEGEILKLNHWWNLIFNHCFRTVLRGTNFFFFWGWVVLVWMCLCLSLWVCLILSDLYQLFFTTWHVFYWMLCDFPVMKIGESMNWLLKIRGRDKWVVINRLWSWDKSFFKECVYGN